MLLRWLLLLGGLLGGLLLAEAGTEAVAEPVWRFVGGDEGNQRYSPLAEINRENVANLEVLWTYRHGDVHDARQPVHEGGGTAFQATPILIDGALIFPTPYSRVIALDADDGREIWSFDPGVDRTRAHEHGFVDRGVAHWRDPDANGDCASRIFVLTTDARLIALDGSTGEPCRKFGKGGTVDLHVGAHTPLLAKHYKFTSNPVVVGDSVVVGPSAPDGANPQPSGNPRAFDARTGRPLWEFDMIPRAGQYGAETWEEESWRHGYGANPWAPMAGDQARGLVFVPGSAPSPHFYGGLRPGDNLFGNTLLALDAATGERIWHFQAVRSDIWDYDLASPPMLVTLERDEGPADAVVLLTKMGLVFVLDRETGAPLFPVEDVPVPASDVPGERTAATQPIPVRPPPLVRTRFDDAELWQDSRVDVAACRERLRAAGHAGLYTPIPKAGGILLPSAGGGANWSGGAFDPVNQTLYVPVNDVALWVTLERKRLPGAEELGPIWTSGGMGNFVDDAGYRCMAPPWGRLVAVDLRAGEIMWRVPVGEDPELGVSGLFNFGHALVTAGGVVLHGGTPVPEWRAHDAATGELLARFEVPAGVHAGPMTYRRSSDGRQVVVVAAGGHHMLARRPGEPLGDWIIAYALPDSGSGHTPEAR